MKKKGFISMAEFKSVLKEYKGITVNDKSHKDLIGLYYTDIEIWGSKETLKRLKYLCPNCCDMQHVDGRSYLLTVYNTTKAID